MAPVVVCYVSSWGIHRRGAGKFEPQNLDPSLFSHLVYAFAVLNEDSTIRISDEGTFRQYTSTFASLRQRNPDLKISLAVGGASEGSERFSPMVGLAQRRKRFIDSTVKVLRQYGFDGLDLDWEYPTEGYDKENFAQLVKELRETFDRESGHSWLLTAAIGAGFWTINKAYDVPTLAVHLDYMHVMSYDYHGAWEMTAGVNAPLRGTNSQDTFSVEKTLDYLLEKGAPARKLVLGLPFYGRTFRTPGRQEAILGAPAAAGLAGLHVGERGIMGYNEICSELKERKGQWRKHWDEASSTPYAVNGNNLITYDDERSISIKVNYATSRDLAGVMVWSVDMDDFLGTFSSQPYPLLHSIKQAFVGGHC